MNQDDLMCTLCEKISDDDMLLSGKRLVKEEYISYKLCRECCFKTETTSGFEGPPSRKKLFDRLEKKLIAISKLTR
jgi:hypothetical protein